jgi:hypothetical protein
MGELSIKKVRRKYLHAIFCGNGPQAIYFRLINDRRRQECIGCYRLPDLIDKLTPSLFSTTTAGWSVG